MIDRMFDQTFNCVKFDRSNQCMRIDQIDLIIIYWTNAQGCDYLGDVRTIAKGIQTDNCATNFTNSHNILS
jgi:hypothetical protein